MNCESISTLLADYWAGSLNEADREQVELHMAGCLDCRQSSVLWTRLGHIEEQQPSAELRARFDGMLAAYKHGLGETKPVRRRFRLADLWPSQPVWQVALAVMCLVGGGLAGHQVATNRAQTGEIARLRTELASTREEMTLSLLQQQSASERLRGVSWSASLSTPDSEVLDALLNTLRTDPSVDVRLAATDALRRYGNVQKVRQGLIEALNAHQSPLVQVALIDALADLRVSRSVNTLKRLESDHSTDSTVRQHAQWAVQQF